MLTFRVQKEKGFYLLKVPSFHVSCTFLIKLANYPLQIGAKIRDVQKTMDDSEGNPEPKHEVQASEFRSAKLPTFWKNKPKLWFAMLEREFAAYGVKNDAVKCAAVIRHLDTTTMKTVADIIAPSPPHLILTSK